MRTTAAYPFGLFLAGLFAFANLAAADVPTTAPTALPRYSLPVGRQLTYSDISSFVYTRGSFADKGTLQLTVTRINTDSSAHLIMRTSRQRDRSSGSAAAAPTTEPADVSYSWVDLFPDGRVSASSEKVSNIAPAMFPQLPADSADLQTGWRSPAAMPEQSTQFSVESMTNGEWVFKASAEGSFKTIYGMTNDATIHFDANEGIVKSIEYHLGQTYGFTGQGTGTVGLVSDKMLSPQEAAALADQFDRYFKARDAYSSAMEPIDGSPDKAAAIAASARQVLADAVAAETSPDIKPLIQQMLDEHDQYLKYELDSLKSRAAVVGHPLPDFSVTDIDGKTHTLADCRGKVLMMDFWYRGCGWCMVAMPQVKQLADDFHGQPVVILGMNTDSVPADAKLVADTLGLNYPTCKVSSDFVEKLGVHAFPSLILVDKDGIVRQFHEGYSPTLRGDVGKEIQALLDTPTKRNSAN